jgi:tetratricopeptide (TPR) repeat protein
VAGHPRELDGLRTNPNAPAIIAPPAGELAVGRVVAGRYEIRARLGAGGMGTVYRALDRELDEEVALKVLGAELLADPTALERFRREVKIARRITHPNVCRVFDLGEDGGLRFLTMELIEGSTLRARLGAGGLDPAGALAILRQIVAGLAAVHAEGVVHRDLKPENVMIRRDGRAVVADFGLARGWRSEPALTTGVAGTPAYMSPEQLRGEPLDARSDVFALGIVAFELLAGRPPFGDGAPALVTSAILRDPPRELEVQGLDADLVSDLEAVLRRALAKDRAERFASAAELDEALRAALGRAQPLDDGAPASTAATGRAAAQNTAGAVTSGAAPPAVAPRRWAPRAATALGVLAVLGAGLAAWRAALRAPAAATVATAVASAAAAASPEGDRPAVLVMTFENLTGDGSWDGLARGAAEAVRAGLHTLSELRVLDGGALVAPGPIVRASWTVGGSVQRVGPRLRLATQLRGLGGAPTGEPIEVDGDPADPAAILDALRGRALDEARLLFQQRRRHLGALRGTRDPGAQAKLLQYHAMIGPGPRPDHFEVGKRLLDEAIAADPRSAPALVERSYLQSIGAGAPTQRERIAAAIADLDRAAAIDPADASTRVMRCRVLQVAAGVDRLTDAKIAAALAACGAALEADPGSAHVRLAFANLHDRRCDDDQAIEAIERVLEMDRSLAGRALERLVSLALATDRMPLADRMSQRLVEFQDEERRLGARAISRRAGISPRQGAHALRGAVLMRLGRLDEARVELERELEDTSAGTGPQWAEAAALQGLARIARQGGTKVHPAHARRLDELVRGYRDALAKDPEIAHMMARAYYLTDPAAAPEWLDRLGAPASCDEAVGRALYYQAAGKLDLARRALDACTPAEAWEQACMARMRSRLSP